MDLERSLGRAGAGIQDGVQFLLEVTQERYRFIVAEYQPCAPRRTDLATGHEPLLGMDDGRHDRPVRPGRRAFSE